MNCMMDVDPCFTVCGDGACYMMCGGCGEESGECPEDCEANCGACAECHDMGDDDAAVATDGDVETADFKKFLLTGDDTDEEMPEMPCMDECEEGLCVACMMCGQCGDDCPEDCPDMEDCADCTGDDCMNCMMDVDPCFTVCGDGACYMMCGGCGEESGECPEDCEDMCGACAECHDMGDDDAAVATDGEVETADFKKFLKTGDDDEAVATDEEMPCMDECE